MNRSMTLARANNVKRPIKVEKAKKQKKQKKTKLKQQIKTTATEENELKQQVTTQNKRNRNKD